MEKLSIKQAYLYLKSYAYHDNLNLFLKERIAQFELNDFDDGLVLIESVLSEDNILETDTFKDWLNHISYHVLPKSVIRPEDKIQNEHNKQNGLFLSNVRSSNNYEIQKVNYFIDAPIHIHILETLWSLVVGPILEEDLTKDCYGNRLHDFAYKFSDNTDKSSPKNSVEIFKRYIDQYNDWRDNAIKKASYLADQNEDIALLSLDLKSYFYHIEIDFNKINDLIILKLFGDIQTFALKLNAILEATFEKYLDTIKPRLKSSHQECINKSGIPIGFASSSILANWYLAEFDSAVSQTVRPAYYGRYVDDILLVMKRPKVDTEHPIEILISNYFSDLIQKDSKSGEYIIPVADNFLPIQPEKLILQYFDKNHSRAGLEVFKQELDEQSSAFKFLPEEHIDGDLDKFAYDVLYDGSANKLRSIVGLAENSTE
ncbi:RNA-directed DNA polymerase [Photobacterium kasasachensis]|uniref:RNA-directed DNA polymerase n=1 Tax=Photobacterium kasasachensis TaxID=2910240 RepID=UPI003D10F5F2